MTIPWIGMMSLTVRLLIGEELKEMDGVVTSCGTGDDLPEVTCAKII
jgi:hypothetical protein